MGKTWREVAVEARERKARGLLPFLKSVRGRAWNPAVCAVGEARQAYGIAEGRIFVYHKPEMVAGWATVDVPATLWGLCCAFPRAIEAQDVDRVDRLLDAIDDAALQLKREQP